MAGRHPTSLILHPHGRGSSVGSSAPLDSWLALPSLEPLLEPKPLHFGAF